jgi:hypothetical protein
MMPQGWSEEKLEKTIKRAMQHQLIILENPPQQSEAKDFIDSTKPLTIIKPSSLNYKVSLKTALESYVKKQDADNQGSTVGKKVILLTQTEENMVKGDSSG